MADALAQGYKIVHEFTIPKELMFFLRNLLMLAANSAAEWKN